MIPFILMSGPGEFTGCGTLTPDDRDPKRAMKDEGGNPDPGSQAVRLKHLFGGIAGGVAFGLTAGLLLGSCVFKAGPNHDAVSTERPGPQPAAAGGPPPSVPGGMDP